MFLFSLLLMLCFILKAKFIAMKFPFFRYTVLWMLISAHNHNHHPNPNIKLFSWHQKVSLCFLVVSSFSQSPVPGTNWCFHFCTIIKVDILGVDCRAGKKHKGYRNYFCILDFSSTLITFHCNAIWTC